MRILHQCHASNHDDACVGKADGWGERARAVALTAGKDLCTLSIFGKYPPHPGRIVELVNTEKPVAEPCAPTEGSALEAEVVLPGGTVKYIKSHRPLLLNTL